MPHTTPAAVICQASLPTQQVVTSTLQDLPAAVATANLRPPSLIVVGECVNLRQATSWFERRPLFGQTIGITRPDHQCDAIAETIVEQSGQPVIMPLIEIRGVDDAQRQAMDDTLQQLDSFHWLIFTSVNGVDAFFQRLWDSGKDARSIGHLQLAAIGSSTAAALEERGLRADVVPESFRAEALASAMADRVHGQNVLWARASRGRDVLPTMLTDAGATVTEVVVYQNNDISEFDPAIVRLLNNGELNWVGLSSPSIARQFANLLQVHTMDPASLATQLASISPVTTAAAEDAGLKISVEATTYTWDGIVAEIAAYLASIRKRDD